MRPVANYLAVVGFSCGLASPAAAQLLTEKGLSAAMALAIAQTALETCTRQGYHVSVHVLGRNGETIVGLRNEKAGTNTFELSMKKAYTAGDCPAAAAPTARPIAPRHRSSV